MSKCRRNHILCVSAAHNSSPTRPSSIQNATLLTFMPPFILIYMYMFELIFNFTAPSIWKIQRKRQKTLTGYLNNSWRKRKSVTEMKKEKRGQLCLKIWKNISIKNFFCWFFVFLFFYRGGIPWAESPFWSDAEQYHNFFFSLFFSPTVIMKRSEYIYTTLTLHKYRNNNYCT